MVAERLIQQLKEGTAPWIRPWKPGAPNGLIPMNPITGKRYKGINALTLMSENFNDPRFMTYKQAQASNAQVRKGKKGTLIQYWKFTEEQIKKDEQGNPYRDAEGKPIKVEVRLERPRVFYAIVFNAEQIEGLPPYIHKENTWNAVERAEHILRESGAAFFHSESNRAFYKPSTDSIHLPHKHQFLSADNYYATALHELSHWSGHSSRMDRDLANPFGSEAYAKEELRAEITSMILGDELGIGHDPKQHASYIGSWIKVLQDDALEIFRAAAEAEKMQAFILSFEQKQDLNHDILLNNEPRHVEKSLGKPSIEIANDTSLNPKSIDEGIVMLQNAQMLSNTKAQTLDALSLNSDLPTEKIWLDIPFKQKELAKEQAGRLPDGKRAIAWDKDHSRWFAYPGADLKLLKPWLVNPNQEPENAPNLKSNSHFAREKIALTVPYVQREAMKQIAGTLPDGTKAVEWDKAAKCWFANPGANLEKLKPWLLNTQEERQAPALTPEQEFAEILRSIGCLVSDPHPIMDGKTHRIRVDGDKKGEKAGFYVGHLDGHPAGYCKNNRTGIEIKWKSKGYFLTDKERADLHAIAGVRIKEREHTQRQEQEQAAIRVTKQLADLNPLKLPTPYLLAKGVKPHSGVYTDNDGKTLYIPAIDGNGKVWSVQYVNEEGVKRFAKNSRKEGCFHALGGLSAIALAPAIVISEGYTTAASISEALGFATISAFNAGNLEPVAKALKEKFPDKPIIIMGDNDKHLELTQKINPGKYYARKAAQAVDGLALFPVFAPGEQSINGFTDFNDVAAKSILGFEGLKHQVESVVETTVFNNKQFIKEKMSLSTASLKI